MLFRSLAVLGTPLLVKRVDLRLLQLVDVSLFLELVAVALPPAGLLLVSPTPEQPQPALGLRLKNSIRLTLQLDL